MYFKILTVFIVSLLANSSNGKLKKNSPPHCTVVSKDTDYISKYRLDYPVVYVVQGQHEAYQQMFCLNPATVNKAWTSVCDWSAPPQVQFTLGDEYMHVVRQDPSGRFLGAAVITTYQLCGHNISHSALENNVLAPTVVLLDNAV